MVTSEELCAALESILAIRHTKQYSTWRETSLIQLARAIAKQYRDDTATISPAEILELKPHELKTFEEGQAEFSSEPVTLVDEFPLGSSYDAYQSLEVIPLPESLQDDSNQSLRTLAAREALYERHPALPD